MPQDLPVHPVHLELWAVPERAGRRVPRGPLEPLDWPGWVASRAPLVQLGQRELLDQLGPQELAALSEPQAPADLKALPDLPGLPGRLAQRAVPERQVQLERRDLQVQQGPQEQQVHPVQPDSREPVASVDRSERQGLREYRV